jgi:hypothetical protein
MATQQIIMVPEGFYISNISYAPIVGYEPPAHPQPEQPAPQQPEQEAGEPRRRIWPEAQEGSFMYNLDNLILAGYTQNIQISREQKENLLTLKRLNVNTFKRVICELRFSANERKNLLASVWRLEKPDLARENARRANMNRMARRYNNNLPL